MDFETLLSNDIERIPHSETLEEFLSEYQCYQVIGEGGFGKVRKAIQLSDQRSVAIKYISDKKITSWYFNEIKQQLIPMEIALMCRCNQVQGVVKIFKYFKIKEHMGWYIVMERFERYIDLFDYITDRGHLSEKMASNFMIQLLSIVTRCHKLGVCHRDIKDENIIIDLETKRIHLIDFGAGGILHGGVYNEFDGTRVYSPPEWIQFKQYHATSLEVWSMGILLYDMVCGNLPFDSDESIVNSIFHFRRSISSSCQDLIQRCLQRDHCKRINISDIINHEWFTQNSKTNTVEPQNPRYRSQFHAPSVEIRHNFSPDCNSSSQNDSGRVSVDTSPFSTPQSSGLEDSKNICETTDSCRHIPSDYDHLYSRKHNNNHTSNCTHSLTNSRKT